MQTTLIDQGLDLMLFGMGTVFVFLTILVFATLLMSRVVATLSPAKAEAETSTGADKGSMNQQPSPQILQAIKLAIAEHRRK